MNARPVKTAVKYAVCGGAILFFVVLLTLVFSFLGTILCALLAGMMLGATKPSKWLSLSTSLLFPAVIFAVLRVWKTDLPDRQVMLVSLLCFGAFWLIYGVMAAVSVFEQKRPAAPAQAGSSTEAAVTEASAEGTAMLRLPPARLLQSALVAWTEPWGELSLDELQGKWLLESAAQDGQARKKEIEIKESKLVLRVVDAKGQVVFMGGGEFKLESTRVAPKLLCESADGSA